MNTDTNNIKQNILARIDEVEDMNREILKLQYEITTRYIQFQTQLENLVEPLGLRLLQLETKTIWDSSDSMGRIYVLGNDDTETQIVSLVDLLNVREDDIEENLNEDDYLFFYFEEDFDPSCQTLMSAFKNSNALANIDRALLENRLQKNLPEKKTASRKQKI
jgi:hypothetical protein